MQEIHYQGSTLRVYGKKPKVMVKGSVMHMGEGIRAPPENTGYSTIPSTEDPYEAEVTGVSEYDEEYLINRLNVWLKQPALSTEEQSTAAAKETLARLKLQLQNAENLRRRSLLSEEVDWREKFRLFPWLEDPWVVKEWLKTENPRTEEEREAAKRILVALEIMTLTPCTERNLRFQVVSKPLEIAGGDKKGAHRTAMTVVAPSFPVIPDPQSAPTAKVVEYKTLDISEDSRERAYSALS
jgi:hypothetical protein